ncbi:MAG TPA: CPBP family intramembrane glutamic endopeptidase [Puia sp.]|nr:CPBP family intramembrane glutamic endopeptidase [Puia sp.]
MVKGLLFISILTLYPIAIQITSRLLHPKPSRFPRPYLQQSAEQLLIILVLLLLEPDSWHRLDFDRIGRGISFSQDIVSTLVVIFILPPVMALLRFGRLGSAVDNANSTYIYGYPAESLPEKYRELPLFVLTMAVGVIFEELCFRQFVFHGFYAVFGIRGDWLLIPSCLLFTIGHSYPKWQDYFSAVFFGLILGKLFQSYGTILVPMLLHFISNTALIILAYRRIAKKN